MEKNTRSRLLEMLDSSKGKIKVKEERVLNYLLEHEDDIQNLSIAEISQAADVSKATVVRFCKSLDFNGLKDFKVWYEAGKGARYVDVAPIGKGDDIHSVAKGLSVGIARGLERTLREENVEILAQMAQDIKDKETIIIYGEGDAEHYAAIIRDAIVSSFPEKSVYFNPTDEEKAQLCLAFSLTGKEKNTMDYISRVVFDGGTADVITANGKSLIAKAATNVLLVSDDPFYSGDEHLFGKISILGVVETLRILFGKDR